MMTRCKWLGGLLLPGAVLLLLWSGVCVGEEAAPPEIKETVCIQCHGAQPGRLGEPVELWKQSVHAANGISCNDCHGGDPTDFAMAMSPERGFLGAPTPEKIPDFCGRCHVGVLEDYKLSKHGQALGKGGPQCVTCHSNHHVVRASLALINEKDCSRCHSYERAAQIKEALAATDSMINNLNKELSSLHRLGIDVKAMKGEVFNWRNKFHRLFHTVEVEKVRNESSKVQAALGKVQDKVGAIHAELAQRRFQGGIAIGLLILAGIVFLLMKRTYDQEKKP